MSMIYHDHLYSRSCSYSNITRVAYAKRTHVIYHVNSPKSRQWENENITWRLLISTRYCNVAPGAHCTNDFSIHNQNAIGIYSHCTSIQAYNIVTTLQWSHNERDGVSNNRRLDCFYSIVCSGSDQRKHESSASLAFVRETTGDWWITLTEGQ